MAATAGELINGHSTNVVRNPQYISYTNKEWAQAYPSFPNYILHTHVQDGICRANFDALAPLDADDDLRLNELAYPPNAINWRLETEADMEHWWHTEVSDVVLAAWARAPAIVHTSHTKPLSGDNVPENVDSTYGLYVNNMRTAVVIGEMKRNLISADQWQSRELSDPQQRLASELRGYASKYRCPQVFCWDGRTLLILQFRAASRQNIRAANCSIDCWVIPRVGSECSLRYALYRLLAQGFRRCQGETADRLTVGRVEERGRLFFTGEPLWPTENGALSTAHPSGYYRVVDGDTGALRWVHEEDEVGVWETAAFW